MTENAIASLWKSSALLIRKGIVVLSTANRKFCSLFINLYVAIYHNFECRRPGLSCKPPVRAQYIACSDSTVSGPLFKMRLY